MHANIAVIARKRFWLLWNQVISDVENSFNAVGKRGKKEKVKFAPRCSEMHNLNTYMGHASEFVTQKSFNSGIDFGAYRAIFSLFVDFLRRSAMTALTAATAKNLSPIDLMDHLTRALYEDHYG